MQALSKYIREWLKVSTRATINSATGAGVSLLIWLAVPIFPFQNMRGLSLHSTCQMLHNSGKISKFLYMMHKKINHEQYFRRHRKRRRHRWSIYPYLPITLLERKTMSRLLENETTLKMQKHDDPGHGWLQVPIRLLVDLHLVDRISICSYMYDKIAYLEAFCTLWSLNIQRSRSISEPFKAMTSQ